MGRKLSIVVAGGLDKKDASALARPPEDILAFVKAVGSEIMKQGHNLLTGCRTNVNAAAAEGAFDYLTRTSAKDEDIQRRIVSYVNQGTAPTHGLGAILQSELADWELGGTELNAPEIIRYSDAMILIGGFRGTYRAANWARIERKPLLPVTLFGGAARDICLQEAKRVDSLYPGNVTKKDYEAVLKSLSTNWPQFAASVVNLAERMATSREVFIVMSFAQTPEYKDLKISIEETCKLFNYDAKRIDDANDQKRILPEIVRGIRHSAFVIADVTEAKANVYWELGLAAGLGKEVIVTAKKGTTLPFDVNDLPVLFWEGFSDFKSSLGMRVGKIAEGQGRV